MTTTPDRKSGLPGGEGNRPGRTTRKRGKAGSVTSKAHGNERRTLSSVAPLAQVGVSARAFPIVGIGASAGGLEALEEFFKHLPADAGMAYVVVTHQLSGQPSLLPELLRKCALMPVVEAGDNLPISWHRLTAWF